MYPLKINNSSPAKTPSLISLSMFLNHENQIICLNLYSQISLLSYPHGVAPNNETYKLSHNGANCNNYGDDGDNYGDYGYNYGDYGNNYGDYGDNKYGIIHTHI